MKSYPLTLAFLAISLLHLCSTATISPAPQAKGMMEEDKIRLGSTPPSCHNRCNSCNPCTAVQVPTLPSAAAVACPAAYNRYANYKPLGWKCRCGDRLFNP